MQYIIPAVFFLFLLVTITYVGYRYYARPGRFYEQIGAGAFGRGTGTTAPGLTVRIVQQIGEKVPLSPEEASAARRELFAAGYRSDSALGIYYGIRVVSLLAFLGAGLFLRGYLGLAMTFSILLLLVAGLAGFFFPSLVLERLILSRRERLRFALPDALDLMTVAVEAGLGLDGAMVKVSEELKIAHQDLSDEFRLVTAEMQAGKPRSEALRNLAQRTGERGIQQLVGILIQTDRFGTSMADALRTHSDFMRVKRRQEAEERANKIAVKLVFPTFFCILPAMFVVCAGPAIIQVVKQLLPLFNRGLVVPDM